MQKSTSVLRHVPTARTLARSLNASTRFQSTTSKQPLMHRILHGNQESQQEIKVAVETKEVNFSQKIARGKYIHEIMVHEVRPECLKEYLNLV